MRSSVNLIIVVNPDNVLVHIEDAPAFYTIPAPSPYGPKIGPLVGFDEKNHIFGLFTDRGYYRFKNLGNVFIFDFVAEKGYYYPEVRKER